MSELQEHVLLRSRVSGERLERSAQVQRVQTVRAVSTVEQRVGTQVT